MFNSVNRWFDRMPDGGRFAMGLAFLAGFLLFQAPFLSAPVRVVFGIAWAVFFVVRCVHLRHVLAGDIRRFLRLGA